MKGRPADRKVSYASSVKINMPAAAAGTTSRRALYWNVISIATPLRLKKILDNAFGVSIIIFTAVTAHVWVADAGKRFQTRSLAGTGNFKPTAPRGHRPAVCQGQLFRSQRSRPGQVRNAATR